MSKFSAMHIPCGKCSSSDAVSVYADDGTHECFSCGARWKPKPGAKGLQAVRDKKDKQVAPLIPYEVLDLPSRHIGLSTCERFRYGVGEARNPKTGQTEACQVATYFDNSGTPVAQKLRFAPDAAGKKTFCWRGEPKQAGLYGAQLWREGGQRIVITEGEIDALSVVEAFRRCPAVSLKDGSSHAAEEVGAALEYLEQFDEVVLAFDQDEPGRKATEACMGLFSPGKVKLANLPAKDANDVLKQAEGAQRLRTAIWEAKSYRPEGIVDGLELLEKLTSPRDPGTPYPWPCLNTKLFGQRVGEIVTWTAGTGIGKSTIVRLIAQDLRLTHNEPVGIISLEESAEEAALAQVGAFMGLPLHLPGEVEKAGAEAIRTEGKKILDGMYFYDATNAGVEPAIILPKLRFMAHSLGIKWVVLDHITMMAGAGGGNQNEKTDELMHAIRSAATQLRIGIHVVCQLRKANSEGKPFEEGGTITLDDLKGSASIKQYSNAVVALERNQQALDEKVSNRITVKALKNRFSGLTGVCGRLRFDHDTCRLAEVHEEAEKSTRRGFDRHHNGELEASPNTERGDF